METFAPIHHAYGFVSDAGENPAGLIDSLSGIGAVRFAARTVGTYDVLIAVEVAGLASLQDEVVPAVAAVRAGTVAWSLVVGPTMVLPKRFRTAFSAFIRMPADNVEGMFDVLVDSFSSLNDREGFGFGAAIVTGKGYDLLVDLGAPSEEETIELVFGLREVTGIGSTETTFCSLEDNAFRREAAS